MDLNHHPSVHKTDALHWSYSGLGAGVGLAPTTLALYRNETVANKGLTKPIIASVLCHGDEREVRNVKRDNRVLNLAVRGYKAVL